MKYIRNIVLYFGCLSLITISFLEPLHANSSVQNQSNEECSEPVIPEKESNEEQVVATPKPVEQHTVNWQYRKKVVRAFVSKVVRYAAYTCVFGVVLFFLFIARLMTI